MDSRSLHRIARLARLELRSDELERTARELTKLLRDIDVLREADADETLPGEIRPRAVEPDGSAPAITDELSMPVSYIAPDWLDGFFTVPSSPRDTRKEDT